MIDDDGFLPGLVLGVSTCLIIATITTTAVQNGKDESWRQQIADHGCAEFYLDQKHDRQWRWK